MIEIARGVNPIGMSYWRNINFHKEQPTLDIFLSINDELTIFTFDKKREEVIDIRKLGVSHTGEGCYFSANFFDTLYVPIDKTLFMYSTMFGQRKAIWECNDYLWQTHVSQDDQMFSATIKDSNYFPIAWAIFSPTFGERRFEIKGSPDECQIDKSGKYLLVKEENYNRIIDVMTGDEKTIGNLEGALGHSDNGYQAGMGENDYSDKPGALDLIEFPTLKRCNIYSTGIWNMGYVSFTHAKPGSLNDQFCLITTPTELIQVWFRGESKVVCSTLTESQEYQYRAKANVCPLGEYAVWTALVKDSLNAYLVKL